MQTSSARRIDRALVIALAATAASAGLPITPVQAQAAAPTAVGGTHVRPHGHAKAPVVAGRVLTVHRRPAVYARGYGSSRTFVDAYAFPGLVRGWNDPDLYSFGGWRFGGDSFYGDQAGDTITRGNATLGAISGYGAARGGYGGPHFDAVGGFHNGPGPDARESADYATGSISTPDYGGVVPQYPSVKARVAALNTGVVSATSVRFTRASAVASAPRASSDETRYLRQDALFPGFGIDAF